VVFWGHEFVGVVETCDDEGLVGRRVVGEINAVCGQCPTCLAGSPTHCPERTTLGIWKRDGAFAEYLTLPAENLHPVPDGVSDDEAVFVEPLAAALEILEQVHVRPTDRVVVLGDGKLGLLVAQVLSLTGCHLTALGRHRSKLSILDKAGIETRLSDEGLDIKADVVVDCTGHPNGFALARAMVKPRGRLVMKSTFHGDLALNISSLVVDEVTLVGSRCGPFAPALRLLERGLVDVRSLIHAPLPPARWAGCLREGPGAGGPQGAADCHRPMTADSRLQLPASTGLHKSTEPPTCPTVFLHDSGYTPLVDG